MSVRQLSAVVILATGVSACSSFDIGGAPSPLPSTPVQPVQTHVLPPLSGGTVQSDGTIAQDGSTPSGTGSDIAPVLQAQSTVQTSPDVNKTTGNTSPAGSLEVTRTDLLGRWTMTFGTSRCNLFLNLTSWAGGYRAFTQNCFAPELQTIAAWNLVDRELQLISGQGVVIARLYSPSRKHFEGKSTAGNQEISLDQ